MAASVTTPVMSANAAALPERAETLHRLLGFSPTEGFTFNDQHRLPAILLGIDEPVDEPEQRLLPACHEQAERVGVPPAQGEDQRLVRPCSHRRSSAGSHVP